MKSKVIQVRDLDIIETELNSAKMGVLACANDKENVGQSVIPFLYSDKNIYFIYDNADDLDGILFDHNASFVVFRSINNGNDSSYKFFQVKCSGTLKKVEETRVTDEVLKNYSNKYTDASDTKEGNMVSDLKIVMIDTEEIQASEIIGY